MTIKETPLIKAVSKSGAWPEFFFTNAIISGFMPILLCALSGALAVLFIASLGSAENALGLFIVVRIGAIFGICIGALLCMALTIKALVQRDDVPYYMQFFTGSILGVMTLYILDLLIYSSVTEWLATVERIQ